MRALRRIPVRRVADGALWAAAGLGVMSMVVALFAIAIHPGKSTLAYWADGGELTTGTFTAHHVEPPVNIDCFNEGGLIGLLGYVRMNWAHVDTRYVYDWRVIRDSNGEVPATGTITPRAGTAQGAPINHEIRIGLLDIGLGDVAYTFEVTARLRDTSWSAGTVTTEGLRTQQLLVGLSVRCTSPVNALRGDS